MKLKAITGIMLTMLLVSMLTLAFNVQPLKADRPRDGARAGTASSETRVRTTSAQGPARFAVIIGIGDYGNTSFPNVPPYPNAPGLGDVNGPDDAAIAIYQTLVSGGWSPSNIWLLVSPKPPGQFGGPPPAIVPPPLFLGLPTRTNIQRVLNWLAGNTTSQDKALIYYSGHGGQQVDNATLTLTGDLFPGDEAAIDGLDENICPMDSGFAGATHITDDEFRSWLADVPAGQIDVILDAGSDPGCHSGGFAGAGAPGIGGGICSVCGLASDPPQDIAIHPGLADRTVVLAASHSTESSYVWDVANLAASLPIPMGAMVLHAWRDPPYTNYPQFTEMLLYGMNVMWAGFFAADSPVAIPVEGERVAFIGGAGNGNGIIEIEELFWFLASAAGVYITHDIIAVYGPPQQHAEMWDGNGAAQQQEFLVIVIPDILIVNDNDGNFTYNGPSLPKFESALTYAGYDYWVWHESSMGNPPLDFLTKFELVIWSCGDYWDWAVDPTDAATLQYYFAQGGNILLEGENIGYNHDADDFMMNVAHATYQAYGTPVPGLTVTDSTHPVTFGLPTSFTWLTPPTYTDGASPTNGGAHVINFTGTTTTAVTVFDESSVGSVVYYAFPLYCLAQPERQNLIINSVEWLLPQEPAHLVVRGSNNIIYYRQYDVGEDTWSSWTSVPGLTTSSPAAAVIDNELHLVVRGMTGNQIWHGYVNLADDSFSGWSLLSGSTPSAPTLTGNSTHLCLVTRGSNNVIYYRFYDAAADVWGGWVDVPGGTTLSTPAAVLADDTLHVAVRGSNFNQIWHGAVDLGTGGFSGWALLSGSTPSPPLLTGNSTHLCLVVRGDNNAIYYRWYDLAAEVWGGWTDFAFGLTPDVPAATITGDSMQIVVRGMNYNQIWHGTLDLKSEAWSGWTLLDGSTPSKPVLAS